jgi:SAM-dependent MidA family methyltransferase
MDDGSAPLKAEIRRRIADAGPMPVAEFTTICLSHPTHGYYMTREPFGREGDFITAPEISQIFGELIGLWAAEVWRMMGSPAEICLIELGPGRGTLMRDALRAAKVLPAFHDAIRLHLVETSPVLRTRQRETLSDRGPRVQWHDSLADIPEATSIVIANEFFDALPVHQAVKRPDGWHERVIGVDGRGRLAFDIAAEPLLSLEQTLPARVRAAPLDAVYEWRSDAWAADLARRTLRGGAALVVDYGHADSAAGDTLQAVRRHQYCDPLQFPGQSDLTAHVDFGALAREAERTGARTHGPVTQATFLRRLGLDARTAALTRGASADAAAEVRAAATRLTESGTTGMGTLFKVLGISHPKLNALPGFDSAS